MQTNRSNVNEIHVRVDTEALEEKIDLLLEKLDQFERPKSAFSLAETCKDMSIGRKKLENLIEKGYLKVVNLGTASRNGYLIPKQSIEEFYEKYATPTPFPILDQD